MKLTAEQSLTLLEAPPSQLRDTLRRTWLQDQPDEELLFWIGVCATVLGARHGKTEAQVLAGLTRLGILQDAAERAASDQARTS
jgi:hypothetical protein